MGCWRWKAGGVGTSRSPLAVPGRGDGGAGRSQTARRQGGNCYLPPADNEPGTDTRCLFANWHREVREQRGREEKKIIEVISAVVSGVGDENLGRGGGS